MIKLRNILIYFIVFIIILISFGLPQILLKLQEINIENTVFEKKAEKILLDVEAEKIYLVKAIHDMNLIDTVEINASKKKWVLVESLKINGTLDESYFNFQNQLKKMQEYGILKDDKLENYSISFVDKLYHNDKQQYIIYNVLLKINNREYSLEIENKTKKILDFSLEKDYFASENKEELMLNYIKYLDLNIIDDWKFENDKLKSEKADLVIELKEDDNIFNFSINTAHNLYEFVVDKKF